MRLDKSLIAISALVAVYSTPIKSSKHDFNLRSFIVDLKGVERLRNLARNTFLPDEREYPGLGDTAGIDLDILKDLRHQWVTDYDWQEEQRYINSFDQYTATIENLITTHFIHECSLDPDAIPLLLGHGWPGSFLEFAPIIKDLTKRAKTTTGKPVSFNVVLPSLPGFAFSQAPPEGWTVTDTARLWHILMTEVLGYKQYAVHGTDFGAGPTYGMYDDFNQSVRAAHFVFLPFFPLSREQLAAQNISLNPLEQFELERTEDWSVNGSAYFQVQSTKPNTLGLALYDSPVGQLSWIGEKFIAWSDPRQGTGPSLLTHKEILNSVSLYYLSRSFLSSVFIYYQNRFTGFRTTYTNARTDAPMLFSAFKYNVGFWPPAAAAQVGNLVSYKNHEFGGHFPGLDNPGQLLCDLRDISDYWQA